MFNGQTGLKQFIGGSPGYHRRPPAISLPAQHVLQCQNQSRLGDKQSGQPDLDIRRLQLEFGSQISLGAQFALGEGVYDPLCLWRAKALGLQLLNGFVRVQCNCRHMSH